MKRGRSNPGQLDLGFTLTELLISMALASIIISGMANVSRQTWRVSSNVRADVEMGQDMLRHIMVGSLVERADPATDALTYQIGATRRIDLEPEPAGGMTISIERDSTLEAQFEIGLEATVYAFPSYRTVPTNCVYDMVARGCRQ